MGSNGLLNEGSNSFTISGCYDNIGNLIGIQLDEKGKGTIIEPPQGTAYKSEFANTNTYIDEGRMAEMFGEERYNNLSDYDKKQAVDLVDELDNFFNTTDSGGGSTSNNNTSSKTDTKEGSVGNKNTTGDSETKHTETNNSESGKTNTSDSSNKSTETNESSSSNNSDTKKTNVSDTGLNDDSKGTQNEIKDTESSIHTGTGDADIKDANSSKYIPGESTSDKSTSSKKGRDVDLESESAKKYLAATGKAADELDDIDKAMINIADKYANNPQGVSDFAKSLGKYDDIIKAGTNTLGYVDAVCTAIYAVQAVYDASKAYEEGNTNNAIGIVAGAVAELVVSTVGTIVIANAISACLMAVGGYREE